MNESLKIRFWELPTLRMISRGLMRGSAMPRLGRRPKGASSLLALDTQGNPSMNKSLKVLRVVALALTVVTALGVGPAYAGVAIPASEGAFQGAFPELLTITCFYCR